MSKSREDTDPCGHRVVIATLPPGSDDLDPPLTMDAFNNCAEAQEFVSQVAAANPVIEFAVLGTRIRHFEEWLTRYKQKHDLP